MTTTGPAVVDGRSARARRTRAAIVAAHVDLLGAGNLKPTGEQIADRAGVSVRSLWIHFGDLEALFAATGAEVLARQDSVFRPVDPAQDLAGRIEGFCRQRAALLERIGPYARASALREPFSPTLRSYYTRHVRRVSDEVEALFAPELDVLTESARAVLVEAITAAATWGAWSTLRDHRGLSAERSRAVLEATTQALLADPPRRAVRSHDRVQPPGA